MNMPIRILLGHIVIHLEVLQEAQSGGEKKKSTIIISQDVLLIHKKIKRGPQLRMKT